MSLVIRAFLRGEDGAVTVDWVVLTAAIVGLGVAVLLVMQPGVSQQTTAINDFLLEVEVEDAFSNEEAPAPAPD